LKEQSIVRYEFVSGLADCLTAKTICHDCHTEKNDYPFYYSIQQDTNSTRSSTSHNQSLALTHSDRSIEKETILCSTSSSCQSPSNSNQFHRLYRKLLQTLPPETDLRYLAVSMLNHAGCRLEIPHTGITLTIPEDAVLFDDHHHYLIYIVLLNMDSQMPTLKSNQTRLSPVLLVGPSDMTLLKPAVLSFEHTAHIDSSWQFDLMFADDCQHWRTILTYGQEDISTPAYLQFHHEHQALLLVSQTNLFSVSFAERCCVSFVRFNI
jgi:hypothetical protein